MTNKKAADNLNKFVERFNKLIEENNETIYTIAEVVNMNKSTIYRYTKGEVAPKTPTIEALARHFGVNPAWLSGYDVPKTLNTNNSEIIEIPVLGCIAAGQPLLSEENIIEYKKVPADQVRGGQFFYLKVKGDSMVNAGIKEGDLALVRSQEEIKHKEIAVVMVNNHEATLKRVFKNNGTFILQPENPNYDPIIVDNEEARIIGKVVGITREF